MDFFVLITAQYSSSSSFCSVGAKTTERLCDFGIQSRRIFQLSFGLVGASLNKRIINYLERVDIAKIRLSHGRPFSCGGSSTKLQGRLNFRENFIDDESVLEIVQIRQKVCMTERIIFDMIAHTVGIFWTLTLLQVFLFRSKKKVSL
jgi:hypothetical protein